MLGDDALETVRTQWKENRPKYEALCKKVAYMLKAETQKCGFDCDISFRAKEIDSLIRKVLRKKYADPYNEVSDKAGVRVVCTYRDSLEQLTDIVEQGFEVCGKEDKAAELEFDKLGYPGIHFAIKLQSDCLAENNELDGLICEIQLLTRAQSLWADISHELAYKPTQPPPYEVQRAIHLQSALVEIFDSQMTEARKVMLELPGGLEMRMLEELDSHFFRFTAAKYDRELSLMILNGLQAMFLEEDLDAFGCLIAHFVESKKDTLEYVFKAYADDDRRSPLLFQPESIVIMFCMERNAFKLKETWGRFMPLDLLQGLADAWGMEDIGKVV